MSTQKASLTYYIFEGVLVGTLGGHPFHIFASSGGGGGSKSSDPYWIDDDVVNNSSRMFQKERDLPATGTSPPADANGGTYHLVHDDNGKHWHLHGGPIPVGRYTIDPPAQDDDLGYCAALIPDSDNHMTGRGGFYFHGRGPHGSDGCIVPDDGQSFQRLMGGLHHDGGGVLHVLRHMGSGPPVEVA